MSPETVLAAFGTPEVALDTVGLRHVVKEAVSESPRVSELYGRRVLALRRDGTGYLVEGSTAEGKEWSERGDLVVNCMWCDRQTLDASVGLVPKRPRVHRLKFRVLVELPEDLAELPSLTFVLGPFGDIVNHGADRCAYLSWYPVCMRGWCGEPEPPQAWRAACRGELHAAEREKIANSTLESFDRLVPGIARSRVRSVDAGVISAFGATDIDHPASGLHQRSQIGVLRGDDGYYSIDTGKLTCAPLFAEQLAARQEPR